MKKFRFLLLILITVAIVFGIYLLISREPEPTVDGHYTYSVADGQATIKSCDTSLSGNVTIPDKLGGFPVVAIAGYAFDGCSKITSLTIPNGVQEIQMYAFENCANLATIFIPRSVTSIEGDAFGNCRKLSAILVDSANNTYSSDAFGVLFNKEQTTLVRAPMNLADPYQIPTSVQNINSRAFFGCHNLIKITIPDGVKSLDWYAFSNCASLTTVIIPSSMTIIGNEAFRGCNALSSVCFKGSAEDWSTVEIKSGNHTLTSALFEPDYCEHIFDTGVIVKTATCKESGIRLQTCTLCGDPQKTAIPKLNEHKWNEGSITRAPNCKDEGVNTYTCTVCSTTRTESVPKLTTHTMNSGITTKEPTCKDTGVMTYTCLICGYAENQAIEMLTTHTPGTPATGTTDQVCTVCGKVLVPATGETEPTEPDTTDPEPTEPDDNGSTGGFFGPIIDFFNAIAAFFENLFAPLLKFFGL